MLITSCKYNKNSHMLRMHVMLPVAIQKKHMQSLLKYHADVYVNNDNNKAITNNISSLETMYGKINALIIKTNENFLFGFKPAEYIVYAEAKTDSFQKTVHEIIIELKSIMRYVLNTGDDSIRFSNSAATITKEGLALCCIEDTIYSVIDDTVRKNAQCVFSGEIDSRTSIYFKPQNLIYVVPVHAMKDGKEIKKSAGYYFTENARKIMAQRNTNEASLAIGMGSHLFDIKPDYIENTKYIRVYNGIHSMRADADNAECDICWCTLADIKGTSEAYGRQGFHDESTGIVFYGNDIRLIMEKKRMEHVMDLT